MKKGLAVRNQKERARLTEKKERVSKEDKRGELVFLSVWSKLKLASVFFIFCSFKVMFCNL